MAQRFASESVWPNFLAFHYTGQRFSADTRVSAVPDPTTPVSGPGAGNVRVSPMRLTSSVVVLGKTITMRADVPVLCHKARLRLLCLLRVVTFLLV